VRGLFVLFEFGAVIAVVILVALVVRAVAFGRPRVMPAVSATGSPAVVRRPVGGRWQSHHYAYAGHTVVSVARMTPAGEVFEEHVVTRIPDSDPDWSRKFLQARQEAEERAYHLNAD
jgi:pyridoxamine 5'-phosphate oxidase family protein